jgi:hypothetical protein
VFAKIRNPVREFMQLFAKFFRWRVTERLLISHLDAGNPACKRSLRKLTFLYAENLLRAKGALSSKAWGSAPGLRLSKAA